MTAEIAVLNKSAVALAADSAVTIGDPTKGQGKVYNGVNKLFSLSKISPVGIMVYGQAEFMGVPWESIIKIYRGHLGTQKFDSLRQYADNFIAFIQAHPGLFAEAEQCRFFEDVIGALYRHLVGCVDEAVNTAIAKKGGITEAQIKSIVAKIVREHHEDWSAAAHLETVPVKHADAVAKKYGDRIEKMIRKNFEKLPLTDSASTHLRELPGLIFSKDKTAINRSGIVVAGFGEGEIFPSFVSFETEGMAAGQLKYKVSKQRAVTHECAAIIVPFAQSEVVGAFMEGIDPYCRSMLEGYLKELLCDMYPKAIGKKIGSAKWSKGTSKTEIIDKTKEIGKQVVKAFEKAFADYIRDTHVHPVIQAVEFLPKEELAAMAESLVNLTSFRRRVSLDAETVGGPIDVAVISKGDGFIWTKRKHYFSLELNPQFYANRFIHLKQES